jgi:malonate decarboxylase gamma subunit
VNWASVADRLFPQGHDIVEDGGMLAGSGRCGGHVVAVIGTAGHALLGVEICMALAGRVLQVIREHPGRPLLVLTDTDGQRMRRRDEVLGINRYLAHLAKCLDIAQRRGHRVIGLVHGHARSGGALATGLADAACGALPNAEIEAMPLAAMARVTRIAEERLRVLAQTAPVFAIDAAAYVRMGAIDAVWEGDLAQCLLARLARVDDRDDRARLGHARGGRSLALDIIERVARDA